jgi:hypothetical protein
MTVSVLTRAERIAILTKRDGPDCFLCKEPFSETQEITFDHWIPQSRGGDWEIANLRLAHKRCNALKGDTMPDDDFSFTIRKSVSSFRSRTMKRSERPDLCQRCTNGRSLGPQESCDICGSGPMPERFPRWAKAPVKECDHDEFWCWACSIDLIERKPAVNSLLGM